MKTKLDVEILDVNKTIELEQLKPVSSAYVKITSGEEFDPDGLFSEQIFGELYSDARLVRFGYIDLRTKVIHPKIYQNLIRLKRTYVDLIRGIVYAVWDKTINDFVISTEDTETSNTGISFFLSHFKDIVFKKTPSLTRVDRISLMNKYKSRDKLLYDKLLVIPPTLRDFKESDNKIEVEEVNKIYQSIINYAKAIPDKQETNTLYDPIRYAIQMRVNKIYEYIYNIIEGKRGWLADKLAKRRVHLGSRNVISAADMSSDKLYSKRALRANETKLPLFQTMKMLQPAVIHQIKSNFIGVIFDGAQDTIPVIDKITENLTYVTVSPEEKDKWTTSEGLTKLIGKYRNPDIRTKDITIKDINNKEYYLYLVRDTGDRIVLIRDLSGYKHRLSLWDNTLTVDLLLEKSIDTNISSVVIDPIPMNISDIMLFKQVAIYANSTNEDKEISDNRSFKKYSIDVKTRISDILKLKTDRNTFNPLEYRALTYIEMFYIATDYAVNKKSNTNSRYPVTETGSTYPSKIHLMSTSDSRLVHRVSELNPDITVVNQNYPILNSPSVDSAVIHINRYPGLNADLDGDQLSFTGLLTDEANEEIDNFFNSLKSIIKPNGDLITSSATDNVKLTLSSISR